MRGLRKRLPPGIAEQVGVLRGEKVLAWGANTVGAETSYVIATNQALYVLGDRVPWHRIGRASWEEPVLDVAVLAYGTMPPRTIRVDVSDSGDLPPAVHDRVTDSVLISEHVDLADSAGARMVARRDSDDGSIHWSVVFDPGLDPSDLALRAAADEALDRLRVSLGI